MTIKINFKNAFSIIELIFAIVIIGIIATLAVPKLLDISSKASVSTIHQDTNSIVSAIQNYHLINKKIDKISDSININTSVWTVNDLSVKYIENEKTCISIEVSNSILSLTIDDTVGDICKEVKEKGLVSTTFKLK
jgi:general secretion pathway protein G